MNKKVLFLFISLISIKSVLAQDTFNTMFYNLLNFPSQTVPANRIDHLSIILTDYQPDIFMVCELNNEAGANSIINMMQDDINPNYAMASFKLNTSDDAIGNQNDLQNLIFFNSEKFSLESQIIIPTLYRDFNHYKLKLNTTNQETTPLYLDVIVGHLKASNGVDNRELRLQMVNDLDLYLNTLPINTHLLLAGDFNLYTSAEPAFQKLITPENHITFIDPANKIGAWHNNTDYIDVFTQSTRTTTGMGGATGGFDDRFDFILTSESMDNASGTNEDLFFVEDSYQVIGNNANVNCYNQDITSNNCAADNDPNTADFSFAIREALYNFSDHLPVTLQIQANQQFLSVPEYTTFNYYEIIGTNIISNTLDLQTNNQLFTNKKLNIFNTLGQLVKSIPLNNTETHHIDVSYLSNGLYYITTPNFNVKPLKFVKVH
ncbi:T9SS type A sorting domain-containing protein [Lacinutrix himadriensis]|uniref:T9SS type A sorting domain-containing protein n=1 Tax=Lacinutrix himadriensis TaxID=641549 RepID=UPI0006E2E87A|nr:T9SS type A sorting domain-containing protein [Lacinutrix himadriensis]